MSEDKLAVANNGKTTKKLGGSTGKGFMPGKSGNPSGRPKSKPFTDALSKIFTEAECLAVAKALAKKARKGSLAHFQEAANRIEGPVQREAEQLGSGSFHVVIDIPFPKHERSDTNS